VTNESAVVLVHGLFSSPATWDPLALLLTQDAELSANYDVLRFGYQSPRWKWRATKRIPDFNTIADSLSTYIEVECRSYQRLVLVSHSQGGLVIQRFLARMTGQGRGLELGRIRRVVLLACPNNGSELLLLARSSLKLWRHPQERDLRPLSEPVMEAQRSVLNSIVFADRAGPDRCPIPFAVYAGESDNIVTPASAKSVFPSVGAIPGDHMSILRSDSTTHRTYTTVKANLLLALSDPSPQSPRAHRQQGTRGRTGSVPGESRKPVLKVTTTTTEGLVSRSQEIEIFDREAADLWIQADRTSPVPGTEPSDAD
jgi:pimeloyl-ACP methyl ester carboxylesterase